MGLTLRGAEALYQTVHHADAVVPGVHVRLVAVAIQIAGGQLTPRIIATTLLRDNVVRYSVGLFVFTLTFAVVSLNRLEVQVLDVGTMFIDCLAVLCLATFLFLIDYAARLLRPGSISGQSRE
jgi:uncharacterized membrane protein